MSAPIRTSRRFDRHVAQLRQRLEADQHLRRIGVDGVLERAEQVGAAGDHRGLSVRFLQQGLRRLESVCRDVFKGLWSHGITSNPAQRPEHFFRRDRNFIDPDADGVVDRVGDRPRGAGQRALADAAGAVLAGAPPHLQEHRLDLRHVEDGRDLVVDQVEVQRHAVHRVVDDLLGQRLADAITWPPICCASAPEAYITVPQSLTMTSLSTCVRPVAVSTSTSAKLAMYGTPVRWRRRPPAHRHRHRHQVALPQQLLDARCGFPGPMIRPSAMSNWSAGSPRPARQVEELLLQLLGGHRHHLGLQEGDRAVGLHAVAHAGVGVHRGDPGDVLRADAQETQRLGAAEHVAGVRAGAGLHRGRIQRDRAVRVEGDLGLHLAAALLLPLGVPAGVKEKPTPRVWCRRRAGPAPGLWRFSFQPMRSAPVSSTAVRLLSGRRPIRARSS